MKNKIFYTFAVKNIKANKTLQIPFILSTGLMFSLFYIMTSLLSNEFVRTRHEALSSFIGVGVVIVALFAFIFVIYANSFLMKRRNKEFALYGILGLEKKHISKILRIEQVLTFLSIGTLEILGGFLIGKLLFLLLNNIMNDKQATLMDYPFEPKAALISLALLAAVLIFTHLLNIYKVKVSNPIELLGKQRSAQKEPKSNWLLMIVGLICLLGGYYIALTTKGLFDAIFLFFISVLLVIVGTYLLFVSFSVILLKGLKRNKSYYYKDDNFLSISGMLYRMKTNGIGLASICILCTGIIITLGTTLTIYKGIDQIVNTTMKTPYAIADQRLYSSDTSIDKLNQSKMDLEIIIQATQSDDVDITALNISESIFVPVVSENNELLIATKDTMGNGLSTYYMDVTTVDDYNNGKEKKLQLSENEVYMTSNMEKLRDTDTLILANEKYKVKPLKDEIPGNVAIGAYLLVVPSHEFLVELASFYKVLELQTDELLPADISLDASWDVSNDTIEYENSVREKMDGSPYILSTKKEVEKNIYSLNGGFLFLGMIIGAIFLIGTILITYYKQVSEGYEDRENYQIMKKVGLRDELIIKTTKKQLIWMFFLPLIVASVHTLIASKILYNLLGIFGVHEIMPFASSLGAVIGVFAIVYLFVFGITSRIYYRIVN